MDIDTENNLPGDVQWELKHFEALSLRELYAAMRLRQEVFVVEQNCPYLDADNYDLQCHHLMAWSQGNLLAYTRLVPPGVIYEQPSIGRVITSSRARRTGLGKELMQRSINAVLSLYGEQPIKIGAQFYLKRFYEGFGFSQCSDIYLEDGIEHIYMIR